MTAATLALSFSRMASQASPSFHGSTTTFLVTAGGSPRDQATAFGRRRPPAAFGSGVTLTMTQSCVP